jgi:hypothetical protein
LVHGIDTCQIDDAEEEDTGAECHTPVALTGSIDLLFSYTGVLDTLVDLLCEFLAVLQLVYKGLVQKELGHSSIAL